MNTKNISLLGLGLFAAAALASCDHIEESLAKPITNPQEPIFSSSSVNYIAYPYINASNPVEDKLDSIAYCVSYEIPDGYQFEGTLELSPNADFSNPISVPLTYEGHTFFVNVGDVATQYTNLYTKDPSIVKLHGRTSLSLSNGSEKVHIGTPDTYFGVDEYTFVPVAPDKIIPDCFYLVLGDGTEWDYPNAVRFNHSETNQYDDPNFSLVVKDGSSVGDKWMVMPEEDFLKVRFGEPLAGNVYYLPVFDRVDNGTNYGDFDKQTSGDINAAALPSISIPSEIDFNAQNMTYSTKAAVENYYATGDGWSNWGAHWMPLFTTNYMDYYGFLNIESQFKFAPQEGWGGDFGSSIGLTESDNNGVFSYNGTLNRASDNIQIGHAGLYWAYLNTVNWTLSLDQTKTWGIIGGFADNSWGSDVVTLTPSEDLYTWTGDLTVDAGVEWKFRANADWAINLGGTADELWNNGGNIVLPNAGTYAITLDLSTYPAKFTAVKK